MFQLASRRAEFTALLREGAHQGGVGVGADEVRHAQSASDLIAKRIAADPTVIPRVLHAAAHFRHFGERAVAEVPVAMPGDPIAIATFARRIERLCGTRLVDHLKEEL